MRHQTSTCGKVLIPPMRNSGKKIIVYGLIAFFWLAALLILKEWIFPALGIKKIGDLPVTEIIKWVKGKSS